MAFLCLFAVLVVLIDFSYTHDAKWTYLDESEWPGVCQTGQAQSPINIVTSSATSDYRQEHIMGPLVYRGYEAVDVAGVNTGHALQWDAVPGGPAPILSGGPLVGNYTFLQMHLHWLSEHAIDGMKYPLEVHLVHVKTGLDLHEAVSRPDGLAVIGILANVKYSDYAENAFEELIGIVPSLVNPASSMPNTAEIVDLTRLFSPDPQSYFTYQGSLTTPLCEEAVIWIVMDQPIAVSDSQYKIMTKVDIGGIQNFRSLQPANRVVYRSVSSCASMLVPSLALLSTLLHCSWSTLGSLTSLVKRSACLALNWKRRVLGFKPIKCFE